MSVGLLGLSGELLFSLLSVLGSSGFLFVGDFVESLDLVSLLVDTFDEDSLILELVTLGGEVETVITKSGGNVQSGVELSLLSISLEKSSETTLSPDPQKLDGHSSVLSTSSLSEASMSS